MTRGSAPDTPSPARQRMTSTNAALVLSLILLGAVLVPIWKPLLLATVAAATLSRFHDKLARRLRNRRVLSATLFTAAATLLILAPLTVLAVEAISQAIEALNWVRQSLDRGGLRGLIQALPDTIERVVRPMVPKASSNLPGGSAAAGWMATQMQSALEALSQFAFDLAMMMIAFFFLLIDGHRLVGWLSSVSPLGPGRTKELLEECRTVARAVIGSNFLTGIAQAATATVGYLIVQAPKPVFFGLATLLSSFIPSVGTAVVAVPLAALLYLSGQHWQGLFLAAWALAVVSVVDNLLRPWLIKSDVHIHGAFVFFSLIGGMMLFGFVGLVVGPLSLGLVTSLIRFRARDTRNTHVAPEAVSKQAAR
jgi:predicted PurR-regulated permease PerM